jgi:DNA-binding NarL/FixJ family response regulator
MNKQNVLLVEDDALLRIGLKSMIDISDDYKIIAEAGTGFDAIVAFKQTNPDMVLLDLVLPDMHGLEVLKALKANDRNAVVVILTSCDDESVIYETLTHGADAYILKQSGAEEIFTGLTYATHRELFISPKLIKRILHDFLLTQKHKQSIPAFNLLTSREKEIAAHISQGKKSKEISSLLSISNKTVDKHRSNILKKLNIKSCLKLKHFSKYFE